MKYKRFENESDEALVYRITGDKELIGSWQEVANILNELLGTNYTESAFRKKRQSFDKMLAANQEKIVNVNEQLEEINEKIRELEKERIKLRTEKQEYNKWLREDARDEMIKEEIISSISKLQPLNIPKYIKKPKYIKNNKILLKLYFLFSIVPNIYEAIKPPINPPT